MTTTVEVHSYREQLRRRWLVMPQSAWPIQIIIDDKCVGWTQARRKRDVHFMVRDWLACTYGTDASIDYRVEIRFS